MTTSTPTPVASQAPPTSLAQVSTFKRHSLRLLYKLKAKFSQKSRAGGVIIDDWTGAKLRAVGDGAAPDTN